MQVNAQRTETGSGRIDFDKIVSHVKPPRSQRGVFENSDLNIIIFPL